jgi:hypothetical protein
MTVALTPGQEAAIRAAVVPVQMCTFQTVAEACKEMGTVLPLVVAVDDEMTESDRTALSELASACGAELFDVEEAPSGREFTLRILDAIARGERRRFKLA